MGPTGAGPICATEYNKWHDQNLTSKKVRGLLGSHPFPCLLRTRLCRTGAAGSTVQSSGGLQGLNFTNADFLHGGTLLSWPATAADEPRVIQLLVFQLQIKNTSSENYMEMVRTTSKLD
jgi:hypothetical protein